MELSATIDTPQFEKLLSLVPEEKQEKVSRFRFDIDKKLSLYSEVILRSILCQKLHQSNGEIAFQIGEQGKPYLSGDPVFFNLSHTRNAIAVAVSHTPVGIDLERVETCPLQVADRFFTANERAYICSDLHGRDGRFYEIWTKKEAYIKYSGKGLSVALPSFDVLENKTLPLLKTVCLNGYAVSICLDPGEPDPPITLFSESDLDRVLQGLSCSQESGL